MVNKDEYIIFDVVRLIITSLLFDVSKTLKKVKINEMRKITK